MNSESREDHSTDGATCKHGHCVFHPDPCYKCAEEQLACPHLNTLGEVGGYATCLDCGGTLPDCLPPLTFPNHPRIDTKTRVFSEETTEIKPEMWDKLRKFRPWNVLKAVLPKNVP